jgi:uncharacterized protein YrrD
MTLKGEKMQIKEGASVYTTDDEKVGKIDRIVLDPESKKVSHVVVQKGFLFTDDKVVPVTSIGTVSADRVILRSYKDNLEEYPDFEESHYIAAEDAVPPYEGTTRPIYPLYHYPPIGTGWMTAPSVYAGPLYIEKTEKNIPEGSIAIDEGTSVVSRDGEKIGEVERVYADAKHRATHILVSEGIFLKEKKLIPTTWFKGITEETIHLAVGSKLLDRLPEYQT